MTTRAQALSERFEQASQGLTSLVETCSDANWKATCRAEGWPVGVTAHHVAESYGRQRGWLLSARKGEALQRSPSGPDEGNARHAQEFAGVTREETLELLRRNGAALVETIRSLTDDELDGSVQFRREGPPWSVAELIERVLIGHVQIHGASIREAIGG